MRLMFLFPLFALLLLSQAGCARAENDALATAAAEGKATTETLAQAAVSQYPDLHELMEDLNKYHRRMNSRDVAQAREAGQVVEALVYASVHPQFAIKEEEFFRLNKEMQEAVAQSRAALERPQDHRALMETLRAQNAACKACHVVYRKKAEASH